MTKRHIANVTFASDEYGKPIALIPVTNRPGQFCKMDKTDWQAWCDAGRSQRLYVQPLGPGRFGLAYYEPASGRIGTAATVARAIMQPPYAKAVFNLTRNIYDMRRSNLVLRDRFRRHAV